MTRMSQVLQEVVVLGALAVAGTAWAQEARLASWPDRVVDVATVTVQALDAHSTWRALEHGATEANPVVRSLGRHPAALVGLKAGAAVVLVYATRKVARHSRWKALLFAAAVNSAYLTVVSQNYQAAR